MNNAKDKKTKMLETNEVGVVGLAGIEPATPTLKVSCSTN